MSVLGISCAYAVTSGFAVNEWYIGRAAASNWLIGLRPRISSMVRSMLDVEYMVESTYLRFVYGETTRATDRWASTWSGPFWASSSRTKIAVSFQNLLFVTASTTIPSARSLSATYAVGVGLPTRVPDV